MFLDHVRCFFFGQHIKTKLKTNTFLWQCCRKTCAWQWFYFNVNDDFVYFLWHALIFNFSGLNHVPVAIFLSVGMLLNDTVFFRFPCLRDPSLLIKLLFRGNIGSTEIVSMDSCSLGSIDDVLSSESPLINTSSTCKTLFSFSGGASSSSSAMIIVKIGLT